MNDTNKPPVRMTPSPTVSSRTSGSVVASSPLDMKTADFNAGLKRRKANRDALIEWIRDALTAGIDYQRVRVKNGKWSKPFLTKAGSEKVLGMLGVRPEFPNLQDQIDMISSGASTIMVVKCEAVDQNGNVAATGAGGRTLEQDGNDINKMVKMCLKSAMIDATLRLGGLSELFTQDEESAHDDDIPPPITDVQAKKLRALAKEVGLPIKSVCDFYGVGKIEELPSHTYLRARKAIEKKRGQVNGTDETDDTGRSGGTGEGSSQGSD
jgi:hypothetical protein